jgi:hypothetical protein
MHIKLKILTLLIAISVIAGCRKKSTDSKNPDVDIYVAGVANNKPVYWKNGVVVPLSSGVNDRGRAYDIAVRGNDVYVVGGLTTTDNANVTQSVVCWKNGTPVNLKSTGTGLLAQSIAIVGDDIYITGTVTENGKTIACYWKNGVKTNLASNSSLPSAISIATHGNDIYILDSQTLAYWKNGVSIPTSATTASARGIAVNEYNDVYMSGSELYPYKPGYLLSNAVYWKNGAITKLNVDNGHSSILMAITLQGDDVYTAGFESFDTYSSRAFYAKNNHIVYLNDVPAYAGANDIALNGTDVYTAGYYGANSNTLTYSAAYWKNGDLVQLGQPMSEATSIVLVQR